MNALVGYTGFVGSNLYERGEFPYAYNSKNIEEAYGLKPDCLVYAGLRAEKYLANQAPEQDMEMIRQAEANITKIDPKKLVLISTVDVLKKTNLADEHTEIDTEDLQAYGYHRYLLECWVREHYPDALIVRLPGLFGAHIKKNFIYDYIRRIPFMIRMEKMVELVMRERAISDYYEKADNGFYRCRDLDQEETLQLKKLLGKAGFSALNFTDSRSRYQFYPLERLWSDIQIALEHDIRLWHPATEPVSAGELYEYLSGETFSNGLSAVPADYDYRTIYDAVYGGKNGYIMSKQQVMEKIREFVQEQTKDEA